MADGLREMLSPDDLHCMHESYRTGGAERLGPLHVVYTEASGPHPGCPARMQAIDFRLEAYGQAVHDPLVTAWWNGTGFAGRCPHCGGWIHFTIHEKRAIDGAEAARLPKLPDDWHSEAVILPAD